MNLTYNDMLNQLSRFIHRLNDKDIIQMCGLAKGTNSATIKTTALIYYFLYNQQLSKAATDDIAMTACAQQAISTFCYYLISVDVSGTVAVTKGTDNTYALPSTPAGNVPIGAIKVTTDASHTFTSGTTDLSAVGITALFYDLDTGMASYLLNTAMRSMERKRDFSGMFVRYSYTLVAATDVFDNPITNYKKLINCYGYASSGGVRYPITKKDINTVEQSYAPGQTGLPKLIALVPQAETNLTPDIVPDLQLMIRPIPDVNYTVIFTAYQYSPFLDGVIYNSNWWILNHFDVLLYAALVESAPYLKDDDQIAKWKALFKEKLDDLTRVEDEEQFAGSLQYLGADNVV